MLRLMSDSLAEIVQLYKLLDSDSIQLFIKISGKDLL